MARCCTLVVLTFLLLDGGFLFGRQTPSTQTGRDLVLANGRRLALVVGIDSYARAPLLNAQNDARAMADALGELGFAVTTLENATRDQIVDAVSKFGAELRSTDVAWFFFAGHGLQVGGENYLVPVDFAGASQTDVRLRTLPVSELQSAFSKARVSVLVLDACRNNPFLASRSGGSGLAPMEARGSLIAFATGAGQTASDNEASGNGLFTEQLLKVIREPDLSVRDMFFRVRQRVLEASGGQQFPAVYDGLVGDLTMRGATPAIPTATRPPDQRIASPPVARPPISAPRSGSGATKWLVIGGGAAAAAGAAITLGGGSATTGGTTAPQTSTATNRPPIITSVGISPTGAMIGSATRTIFEVVATDPDGDPMTAIWSSGPPTPTALTSGRATLNVLFNANSPGPVVQNVTVSDGRASASQAYPAISVVNLSGLWTGQLGQTNCTPPSPTCYTIRVSLSQSAANITGDYEDQFGRSGRVTGSARDERALVFTVTVGSHPVAGAGGPIDFSLTGNASLTTFSGIIGSSIVTLSK